MGKASTEANDDLVINQVEDVTSKQKFSIFCGSYEGAIIGLAGDLSKMELKYAFKPSTVIHPACLHPLITLSSLFLRTLWSVWTYAVST